MVRRFDINPGPLRVVEGGRNPQPDYDANRCEQRIKSGAGRCSRDGVTQVRGRWLCRQHARRSS